MAVIRSSSSRDASASASGASDSAGPRHSRSASRSSLAARWWSPPASGVPAVGGEAGEHVRVDLVPADGQPVAGGVELDLAGQRPPQPRHLRLQRVGGVGRRVLPVQAVDEPVGRDDLAGVQQQPREQGPHPWSADGDLLPVGGPHQSRAEDTEPH
ncbi:hypothetical protein GCM10018954_063490 [Kutzneria kofuensis]